MNRPSALSNLSVSILCQLLVAPQTGYSLKRQFEDTPMGHFSSSPGAIYPALQRMEKVGWVRGKIDNPKALRARKVYRVTEPGRKTLRASFREPVTRQHIIHDMDLLLLRFAFMTPLLGRDATLSYLSQFADQLKTYLEELIQAEKRLDGTPPEAGLALQHGIAGYRTSLAWAESTHLKLKKLDRKKDAS